MCILHLHQISIQTSHISSAQEPHDSRASIVLEGSQHLSLAYRTCVPFCLSVWAHTCQPLVSLSHSVSPSPQVSIHPSASSHRLLCATICVHPQGAYIHATSFLFASPRILPSILSLPCLHLCQPGSLLLSKGVVNFALSLHILPAV